MTRSLESSQVSLRSSLKDNLLEKFDSKLSLCGRNIFGDRRLLSYIIIISVGNWDFLVGILISQQFELNSVQLFTFFPDWVRIIQYPERIITFVITAL